MQQGAGDVQEVPTLTLSPLHQPATAITVPAPSSSATAIDDDRDATVPPEGKPKRETETWQEADATDRTRDEKPMQPETPERNVPPPGTALHARADETAARAAQDGVAFKSDDGCTTPPAHGSDDDRAATGTSGKRAGVAAARSRLLAFRSFARGKKGKKSGDAALPEGRAPSPGEHLPAHGKAWEEAGADDKEKGHARWKRFWK